jgi:hypothetical protein
VSIDFDRRQSRFSEAKAALAKPVDLGERFILGGLRAASPRQDTGQSPGRPSAAPVLVGPFNAEGRIEGEAITPSRPRV